MNKKDSHPIDHLISYFSSSKSSPNFSYHPIKFLVLQSPKEKESLKIEVRHKIKSPLRYLLSESKRNESF